MGFWESWILGELDFGKVGFRESDLGSGILGKWDLEKMDLR